MGKKAKGKSISSSSSDSDSDDDKRSKRAVKGKSVIRKKREAGVAFRDTEAMGIEKENTGEEEEETVQVEESRVLVEQIIKENKVIATHVQFLKTMKGIIPVDEAISRLFILICNGPQLANGEVFSDITMMQTTTDFILGLITDPSLDLHSINNVVKNMKEDFPLYSARVLRKNLYCEDNFFISGFTVGLLNQMKQSVHLKYCVSTIMSNLFTVCLSKRFHKCKADRGAIYRDNLFFYKLKNSSHDLFSMLTMNIKCFVSLLAMYGHVYFFEEAFFKEYWEKTLECYSSKMGANRRAENIKLLMESFGPVQTIIYNLLDNVGNCITNYSWLYLMEKQVTTEVLVMELCSTILSELAKAQELVSPLFINKHLSCSKQNSSKIEEYMEEMKYCIVQHFGKNKCFNVKHMIATTLAVNMRD